MRVMRFDVVVAGCGVAGLSAAVAAAEAGARVAVLERAPREERGGQSRYTEAYLRMKSETEVTDDFETHLAENSSGNLDPDLIAESARRTGQRAAYAAALSIAEPGFIATFADQAGPTIAWLKGFGLRFDFLPTQFLTKSQPRLLPVGGGLALVEGLAARAEKLGVEFLYETTAERAGAGRGRPRHRPASPAAGRKGGCARRPGGAGLRRLRGQCRDADALHRPARRLPAAHLQGRQLQQGRRHPMALDAGAATAGDFGSYHAEPVDPRSGVSEPSVFVFPYGILVNKDGRRFTDEAPGTVDAHYESITRRIFEQRDGMAYVVLDAQDQRVPNVRLGIRTDKPPIVADTWIADSQRKLGDPAARWQRRCALQRRLPAGRLEAAGTGRPRDARPRPPKSNWALPLDGRRSTPSRSSPPMSSPSAG